MFKTYENIWKYSLSSLPGPQNRAPVITYQELPRSPLRLIEPDAPLSLLVVGTDIFFNIVKSSLSYCFMSESRLEGYLKLQSRYVLTVVAKTFLSYPVNAQSVPFRLCGCIADLILCAWLHIHNALHIDGAHIKNLMCFTRFVRHIWRSFTYGNVFLQCESFAYTTTVRRGLKISGWCVMTAATLLTTRSIMKPGE